MGDTKEQPRHAGGRPTDYELSIIDRVYEYLEQSKDTSEILGDKRLIVVNHVNLPSIEGLALYLEINKDTIYEWEKIHKEFSDVIMRVRNEQAKRLINCGLAGSYNPQIAKVLLTKHGYIDRQDVTTNNKDLPSPILGALSRTNINDDITE